MLVADEQMRNIFVWLAEGWDRKDGPCYFLIIPYFIIGLAV